MTRNIGEYHRRGRIVSDGADEFWVHRVEYDGDVFYVSPQTGAILEEDAATQGNL
jgi:hypothetical protein